MEMYRHMAVFAAVARAGSFTLAGRKLGLAKSAVSRIVSDLEENVGVSLLSRNSRKVKLTEPGAVYLESCIRMISEAESAAASLRDFQTGPAGELRITLPAGLSRHVMPILAELSMQYEKLCFDVRVESRYANLLEEDIDLAIRGGAIDDSSLIARKLASVQYVVCASPRYLGIKGTPRDVADLRSHEWISPGRGPSQLIARRGGNAFSVALNSRWRANSGVSIIELLRGGHGICLAPLWDVIDELRAGTLSVVLPDYQFKSSAIFAITLPGRQHFPKVMVVRQRLVRHFSNLNWDRVDPSWVASSSVR